LRDLLVVWKRRSGIWLFSFSAYHPLEYFVWGIFVIHIGKKYHNNLNSLVAKSKKAKGCLDKDIMARAYKQLRSRLKPWYRLKVIFLNNLIHNTNMFHILFSLVKLNDF
jgi:hypothetical protein